MRYLVIVIVVVVVVVVTSNALSTLIDKRGGLGAQGKRWKGSVDALPSNSSSGSGSHVERLEYIYGLTGGLCGIKGFCRCALPSFVDARFKIVIRGAWGLKVKSFTGSVDALRSWF